MPVVFQLQSWARSEPEPPKASPPIFNQPFFDKSVSSVSQPTFPITVCMPYASGPGEVSLKDEMASTFKSTVQYFLTYFGNDSSMLGADSARAAKIADELFKMAASGKKPDFSQSEQKLIYSIVSYIHEQNPEHFELAGMSSMERTPEYVSSKSYDTYERYKDNNFQIAAKRAEAGAAGLAALFTYAGFKVSPGYFHISTQAIDINPDAMYRFLSGEEVALPDGRRVRLSTEQAAGAKALSDALGNLLELDPDRPDKHRIRPDRMQEYNEFLAAHKTENLFLDLFRGVSFEQKARCELVLSSVSRADSSKDGTIAVPMRMDLQVGSDRFALTSSAHANARFSAWLEDSKGNKIADVPVGRAADENSPAYVRFQLPGAGHYSLVVQGEYIGPNNTVLFQTPPMRVSFEQPSLNLSSLGSADWRMEKRSRSAEKMADLGDIRIPSPSVEFAPVLPIRDPEHVDFKTLQFLKTLSAFGPSGDFSIPLKNAQLDIKNFQSLFASAWYAQTTKQDASGFGKKLASMLDASQMPARYFKFNNGNASASELAALRAEFTGNLKKGLIREAASMLEADHLGRTLFSIVDNSKITFSDAMVLKYSFSTSYNNLKSLHALYDSLAGRSPDTLLYIHGFDFNYNVYGSSSKTYSEDPYRNIRRTSATRTPDQLALGANVSFLVPLSGFPILFGFGGRAIPLTRQQEYTVNIQNPANRVPFLPIDLSSFTLTASPFNSPSMDWQANTKALKTDLSSWNSSQFLGVYAGYRGHRGPDAFGNQAPQDFGLISVFHEIDNNPLTSNIPSMRTDLSLLFDPKLVPSCVALNFTYATGPVEVGVGLDAFIPKSGFFNPSPYSASLKLVYRK